MTDYGNYNPDYFYMSLGGGVQSGTLAEMIAEGELPAPAVLVFADTGDEPSYVYEYVDYLRGRLDGISPILTVKNGHILNDIFGGGRFAALPFFTDYGGRGQMKRQCTSNYKITPILKAIKNDLLSRDMATKDGRGISVKKGLTIHGWLGISLDEVQRMKPSRDWWVESRWPLINMRMSRNDCKLWLSRRGLPTPLKSSCLICPYHGNNYYRWVKNSRNGDWKHIVKFDHDLRSDKTLRIASTAKGNLFMHRDLIPLDEVDLRSPEEKGQLRLFDDDETMCDSGYCFT